MENELDKLGRTNPPKASNAARNRAMALAMQAFDAQKENATAPQGTEKIRRQSSITSRLWSTVMNGRLLAGSALATLLIVPAAGYLAVQMVNNKTVDLGEVPVLTEKAKTEDGRVGTDQKLKVRDSDFAGGKQLPKQPETKVVADKQPAGRPVTENQIAKTETAAKPEPAIADEEKADADNSIDLASKETESRNAVEGGARPAGEIANLMDKAENAPADAMAAAPVSTP